MAVRELAARLARTGHAVTVFTTDMSPASGTASAPEPVAGVEVLVSRVTGRWRRRLYDSPELAARLRSRLGDFDLVDIHGLWSLLTSRAGAACVDAGVPYVLTPHGQMGSWDWSKRPVAKRVFFPVFLRHTWDHASAIRYLSEGERASAAVKDEGKARVVPNGVTVPPNGQVSRAGRDRLRTRLGIPADALVYLLLGRLTPQKGVLELVAAFRNLRGAGRNTALLLVGPQDPAYSEQLASAVRADGSAGRVVLAGPAYGDEKQDVFAAADVFVTLSRSEGMPLAVLEAMGAGLPVIVTPQANLPAVGDCEAGLQTPGDGETVTAAMAAMLDDEDRLRYAANARRVVETLYSWDAVLPQVADMYERIVACRR